MNGTCIITHFSFAAKIFKKKIIFSCSNKLLSKKKLHEKMQFPTKKKKTKKPLCEFKLEIINAYGAPNWASTWASFVKKNGGYFVSENLDTKIF